MAVPFRADQVGSLLRPPELIEARIALAEGRLSEDQLCEQEDRAILTALPTSTTVRSRSKIHRRIVASVTLRAWAAARTL